MALSTADDATARRWLGTAFDSAQFETDLAVYGTARATALAAIGESYGALLADPAKAGDGDISYDSTATLNHLRARAKQLAKLIAADPDATAIELELAAEYVDGTAPDRETLVVLDPGRVTPPDGR